MGGIRAAGQKAADKAFSLMDSILRTVVPRVNATLENANVFISNLNEIPGHLATTVETTVASTSSSVVNLAKIGAGITGLKYFCDIGISLFQTVKLVGVASDMGNDFKKFVYNTIKTEDELVNILKKASSDFTSSANQCVKDIHEINQNFAHTAESLSQSSHLPSESTAYISQDFHQASPCFIQTSRYFTITCISLTTSALMGLMAYLQNSSCDRDPESTLCVAPVKSMAAVMIATGFVALSMLTPNRFQHQINEPMELSFFIPEKGVDQNFKWTEEQLASIKDKNFAVFSVIEAKRKLGIKWTKQDLKWLLSQDQNIFLEVIRNGISTSSDHLDNNKINF